MDEAVDWCGENGKRGWSAVQSGLFTSMKAHRTINKHLDGVMKEGEQKRYCSLLTSPEETSLIRYIKNRSRCLQGMSTKEVEVVALDILKTREQINKKGGRRFSALSKVAKDALRKKKVSRSFFLRLRTTYPELKIRCQRR